MVGHVVVDELRLSGGESVEHCDDHEGDLNHQEDRDDDDAHDGDPETVPSLHLATASPPVVLCSHVVVGQDLPLPLSLGDPQQQENVEDDQGNARNQVNEDHAEPWKMKRIRTIT